MAKIKVVNKRNLGRATKTPEGIVRRAIHRGTPLGNPFVMGDYSDKERNRVCDSYGQWLPAKLLQDGAELRQFQELLHLVRDPEVQTLELICFCAPKRCHGDTVKKLLEDAVSWGSQQ